MVKITTILIWLLVYYAPICELSRNTKEVGIEVV